MFYDNKEKLHVLKGKASDFTRDRKLTLEHTIGFVLHMVVNRNENGHDITAQNYYDELGRHIGDKLDPITHQSVSEARGKLKWEGFEFLPGVANREDEFTRDRFRYRGHVTRAVDGTGLITPRKDELLEHFSPRISKVGEGHYPACLLVTATNVFTGQPVAGRVVDHKEGERDQLVFMVRNMFRAGVLSLLDRGFGARWVFWDFEEARQY